MDVQVSSQPEPAGQTPMKGVVEQLEKGPPDLSIHVAANDGSREGSLFLQPRRPRGTIPMISPAPRPIEFSENITGTL